MFREVGGNMMNMECGVLGKYKGWERERQRERESSRESSCLALPVHVAVCPCNTCQVDLEGNKVLLPAGFRGSPGP